MDKALPPKPVDRKIESPEDTGLSGPFPRLAFLETNWLTRREDATASTAKRISLSHPPLQPSNSSAHTSSSRHSVNPLTGIRDSGAKSGDVNAKPTIVVKSPRVTPQLPGPSGFSPVGNVGPVLRASLGHVANYKRDGPVKRQPTAFISVDHTVPPATTRSTQDGVDDVKAPNKLSDATPSKFAEVKGGKYRELGSISPSSSARSDDGRRFTEYGCGPSIRFAPNAHETIMGYAKYVSLSP